MIKFAITFTVSLFLKYIHLFRGYIRNALNRF